MIEAIKSIFRPAKVRKYSGFSDFFLHAPETVKERIMTEAAHKANKDQLEVFTKAGLKVRS
ncbi:hypothetical protein GW944_00185 [Candidatus Parcubacteria bacterium]|nr:hypothetical protein [Candidatus Parcubacteria bacterium]